MESEKLAKLAEILGEFSPEDIKAVEECDPQFIALKNLLRNLKNEKLFFRLTVINALLSYQLRMKGEEYWKAFSEFFSKNPSVDAFREFLPKYSGRFLKPRLSRFERAKNCVDRIFSSGAREPAEDLERFVDALSSCMKQKKESKTISFSAKMFLYCYRIARGKDPKGLERIAIPLDSRLSRISKDRDFWEKLSLLSGIPQIRLDVLFWTDMDAVKDCVPPQILKKLARLKEIL